MTSPVTSASSYQGASTPDHTSGISVVVTDIITQTEVVHDKASVDQNTFHSIASTLEEINMADTTEISTLSAITTSKQNITQKGRLVTAWSRCNRDCGAGNQYRIHITLHSQNATLHNGRWSRMIKSHGAEICTFSL